MTVAFTKTPLGNKRFIIEWSLTIPDENTEIVGDTFEAVDCELVSIHSVTIGTGLSTILRYGNNTSELGLNLSSPDAIEIITPPIPQVAFYHVSAGDAAGTSKISLLFKEI